MRKLLKGALVVLLSLAGGAAARAVPVPQDDAATAKTAPKPSKPRGPVFRATKDQIKQAQTVLKQKGHYAGEATGKLDTDTRAGLKKYQEAEGIKVTGTLNRVTLEKMIITLTEKQKAM